ncbi:MAG: hypothetical protein WAU86_14240 [Oricola sp.]
MSMPAPRQEQVFALLLSIWAGLFTWSIIGFSVNEHVAGVVIQALDRFTLFELWQAAAAVFSLIVYFYGRAYPPGSALRWVSRAPLALAIAMGLGIAAFAFYGGFDAAQG